MERTVPRGVFLVKTNFLNNFTITRLNIALLVCLLGLIMVTTFSPARAAETTGNELAIIQVIHEGPHETVLIVNLTREKIDLCGYLLKAEKAGMSFDFAKEADCKATIAPLSIIRIHSGSGSSEYYASWQDIPWSQEGIWDNASDKAKLVNPEGEVISTFTYGADYE